MLSLVLAFGLGSLATASWAADKKGIEGLPLPDALETAPAATKPGVDARGRKVASVDMKSSDPKIEPPKEISFDINYDLSLKVSGAGGNVYDPNFKQGTVTVKDGVPYFNGQPLEDQGQKDLAEAYKKTMK